MSVRIVRGTKRDRQSSTFLQRPLLIMYARAHLEVELSLSDDVYAFVAPTCHVQRMLCAVAADAAPASLWQRPLNADVRSPAASWETFGLRRFLSVPQQHVLALLLAPLPLLAVFPQAHLSLLAPVPTRLAAPQQRRHPSPEPAASRPRSVLAHSWSADVRP